MMTPKLSYTTKLFLLVVLIGVLGDPGVDHLGPVGHHATDQTLLLELNQGPPGKGSTHLQVDKVIRHSA